jgi:hypothetical protein
MDMHKKNKLKPEATVSSVASVSRDRSPDCNKAHLDYA